MPPLIVIMRSGPVNAAMKSNAFRVSSLLKRRDMGPLDKPIRKVLGRIPGCASVPVIVLPFGPSTSTALCWSPSTVITLPAQMSSPVVGAVRMRGSMGTFPIGMESAPLPRVYCSGTGSRSACSHLDRGRTFGDRRAAGDRFAESGAERRTGAPPLSARPPLNPRRVGAGGSVERKWAPLLVGWGVGSRVDVVPRHVVETEEAWTAGVQAGFCVAGSDDRADPQHVCDAVATPQPTGPVYPRVGVAELCRIGAAVIRGSHRNSEGATYSVMPSSRRPARVQ